MKQLVLRIGDKEVLCEKLLSRTRQHITIGSGDAAYNCITIDDDCVDTFQCQLSKNGETWIVENGQFRTNCPKGIHHDKEVVCNACRGCCVNGTPGHPSYSWRYPKNQTLLNGKEIPEGGAELHDGDVIKIGENVAFITRITDITDIDILPTS